MDLVSSCTIASPSRPLGRCILSCRGGLDDGGSSDHQHDVMIILLWKTRADLNGRAVVVLMNPCPPQRRLMNTVRGVLGDAENAIFYCDRVHYLIARVQFMHETKVGEGVKATLPTLDRGRCLPSSNTNKISLWRFHTKFLTSLQSRAGLHVMATAQSSHVVLETSY